MNIKWLEHAIKLSEESLITGDVPIGAVIVYNDEIIGKGYNTREKDGLIIGHAEVNAIIDASKRKKSWNLSDCDLYVTLKPCSMCMEIIKQSRIKSVYYLIDKPSSKKEYDKTKLVKVDQLGLEEKCVKELSDFFAKLREK